MKNFFLFFLSFSVSTALAVPPKKGTSICFGGESCFGEKKKPERVPEKPKPIFKTQKKKHSVLKKKHPVSVESGWSNLPDYYHGYTKTSAKQLDPVVFVVQKPIEKLSGIFAGDLYPAVIEQKLEVSTHVKQPVRAILMRGPYSKSILLGEASLDLELKRVLLHFDQMQVVSQENGKKVFRLKAVGLSRDGTFGLKGEYHSNLGLFLIAETASAFGAGLLDSTIQRNQTAFGTYVTHPSLRNSAKSGAVTGISQTADRFSHSIKNAPESTTVNPWQEIQIFIQDVPKSGSSE